MENHLTCKIVSLIPNNLLHIISSIQLNKLPPLDHSPDSANKIQRTICKYKGFIYKDSYILYISKSWTFPVSNFHTVHEPWFFIGKKQLCMDVGCSLHYFLINWFSAPYSYFFFTPEEFSISFSFHPRPMFCMTGPGSMWGIDMSLQGNSCEETGADVAVIRAV